MKRETLIVDFLHEATADMPVRRKVEVFRAFGALVTDEAVASHLYAVADELAAADNRAKQLLLNFHAHQSATPFPKSA